MPCVFEAAMTSTLSAKLANSLGEREGGTLLTT